MIERKSNLGKGASIQMSFQLLVNGHNPFATPPNCGELLIKDNPQPS